MPDRPPPVPAALEITRDTLDALLAGTAAVGWDDATHALEATGRLPLDAGERDALGPLADRFPLLG